jgi:hypothetical protein
VHQVDLLSREPPDADGPVSLKTEPSRPTRLDGKSSREKDGMCGTDS